MAQVAVLAAATVGATVVAAKLSPAVDKAARLVVLWPLMAVGLKVYDALPEAVTRSWFPDDPQRAVEAAMEIAAFIRAEPHNQRLFARVTGPCTRVDANTQSMSSEPLKNRTTAMINFYYPQSDGTELEVKAFFKFTGKRRVAMLVRSLSAAFVKRPKEISMYEGFETGAIRTPAAIGPVPRMLTSKFNSFSARSLLALTAVDTSLYGTLNDAAGASLHFMSSMMKRLAIFQAANWQPARSTVLPEQADRRGIDFLSFTAIYLGKHPHGKTWFTRVWRALEKYYAKYPNVCVVHGDCRPGNIMVRRSATDFTRDDDVAITDWECGAVGNNFYDPVYLMVTGMKIEDYRKHQPHLLQLYLTTLRANLTAEAAAGLPPDDVLQMQANLVPLALRWYGFAISQSGHLGKNQGNRADDTEAWADRVRETSLDSTLDVAKIAAVLEVSASDIVAMRDDLKALRCEE